MTTSSNDFNSLVASVVENCDEISIYIRNTDYMKKRYPDQSARYVNHSSKPFEYLGESFSTRLWDEYFFHVIDLWDTREMSGMRLNALIERLSAPAARLDILVPRLERECQRLRNVPRSVPKSAREMHSCVNGFLNSADVALSAWKKRESEWR